MSAITAASDDEMQAEIERLRAENESLKQQLGQRAQEGCKLMPLEPTPEMLSIMRETHWRISGCQLCRSDYQDLYRAMLSAAPAQPEPSAQRVRAENENMKTRNAAVREAVKDRIGFFQGARRLEFALRVREKMKEKGLRNQDVAERLGVSEANVSRWLRGNQNIGLDTMYQLADAIEVPLSVDLGECFNEAMISAAPVAQHVPDGISSAQEDAMLDTGLIDVPFGMTAGQAARTVANAMLSAAPAQPAQPAQPADPMDWPLPCDVTVGHGTIGKGCKLRTLVRRMETLYELAHAKEPAPPAGTPAAFPWPLETDKPAAQKVADKCEDALQAIADFGQIQEAAQDEPVAVVDAVAGAGPNDVSIRWHGGITRVGEPLFTLPQPARKPMTEHEILVGWSNSKVCTGSIGSRHQAFAEGVRFAERHHGIGASHVDS